MMGFTERGFIWVKTIENRRGISGNGGSASNEIRVEQVEQVEKVFENVFLAKKEEWEVKVEKFLPNNSQI